MPNGMLNLGGMDPMDQGMGQAPEPSLNFDVDRNPQDMQLMTDAMMYAPMLKGMDEEQRAEKWPAMVQKLTQVSPKASQILDPSLPPSDDDLDALMQQMPQGQEGMEGGPGQQMADDGGQRQRYLDDQVRRQTQGLPPISPEEFAKEQEKKPEEVERLKTSDMSDDEIMAGAISMAQAEGQQVMFDVEDKKKEKPKTPEQAGKIMMMNSAKALLPTIKTTLFKEDGGVNWDNVKKSNIPIIGGAVPWSGEAKRLANAYEVAIQGITRSETGAAMPASEVDNTRERYQCNVWDTEDSCVQKYLSLKLFVNGYTKLVSKGRDGKAHFDSAKADAADAQVQLNVQNYKKDWMQRAMKANPDASVDQLNKLFNYKLLNDKSFLDKMGKKITKAD